MKFFFVRPAIAVMIVLFLLPSYASARKRKGENTNGRQELVEPDRLTPKLKAERTVLPQADLQGNAFGTSRKGHINTSTREGLDVSHYQLTIDWAEIARREKVAYVYIKATEGSNLTDDYYRKNIEGARKQGISVGAYHFYRPNIDWRSQLSLLTRVVKAEEQDLVPMIDIERFSGPEATFIKNLTEFVEAVTKHYGKRPLLYTYQNFYNKHFVGLFREYHWMVAAYGSKEPVLSDGRSYIMWQYSGSSTSAGIRGKVDRSRLMKGFNLKQLQM